MTGRDRGLPAGVAAPLPSATAQAERLIALGVHELAGLRVAAVRAAAEALPPGALLVVHPRLAAPSALAPLLERDGRPGFVVADMTDVDAFAPVEPVVVPDAPFYAVTGVHRGDDLRNRSPDEALPALIAAGRTPLTLGEGVHWLLQCPGVLARNACFMTVGSRLRKAGGRLDARTPALWISNGTGRDGPARRGAPKVGWCWAGNRHTWLGFASATARTPL
ncbi:hypothetical protein E9549_21950 [Blastococcus sp. MG754426]|uniref:DUF5701 family protein n=1 Tax=unclassified Blastococcus TaxID=2619396 RepID=UPI001EEF7964|nr:MULTISPECIES: DUF5701 family protein [unclassified Blastococcus]MCF6510032.1 hypothetical protein [Blastococcus sp. MG754426]MCF6514416.1 hypothetical protein [Blastococcus sp. MG754427]MCF6737614.1 hypothetical protein [Blastococcus sp. KM273129]